MRKVYVGQTALRFQLTTDVDITGADCKIKYQKPDGTEGDWDATIADADYGIIYYDIQESTELDQPGDWVLWAYVTFADSTTAAGEPTTIEIFEEGI